MNNLKKNYNKRLKAAFDKARALGVRYFFLDGKSFNTRKRGESLLLWAKNFKDNATVAGSNKVQVSINYGWKNGTDGYYNDKGQFIKYAPDDKNHVLGMRGQNRSGKGYATMDGPEANPRIIGKGSLQGKAVKRNQRDGSTIIIGQSPTGTRIRPVTNAVANERADDYVDRTVPDASDILSLPAAAVAAPVEMYLGGKDVTETAAWKGLSGRQADRSGYGWYNPFGLVKNGVGYGLYGHEAGRNGLIQQGMSAATKGVGDGVLLPLSDPLTNKYFW